MNDKNFQMEPSWLRVLQGEFEKPYMKKLGDFLRAERAAGKTVYPNFKNVFDAFWHTPYDQVKVVIMGQDPYHGAGQAHGLSFSVPEGVMIPPSLQNIFKEIEQDLRVPRPKHGCLVEWAKQGVLLLNATLTVRADEAKSHFGQGWEIFTDRVIQVLSERKEPLVFVLWGKSALDKFKQVDRKDHLVLTAPHPSPLSAYGGFFGCRHFSKINEFLIQRGSRPIDWEAYEASKV